MTTKATLVCLFACLQVIVYAEEPLKPNEAICVRELSLDSQRISIQNRDIVPENNPEFSNFLSCYYKSKGWQDEGGNIVFSEFSKDAPEKYIPDVPSKTMKNKMQGILNDELKTCEENYVKGSTDGDTVVHWQNCVANHMSKRIKDEFGF